MNAFSTKLKNRLTIVSSQMVLGDSQPLMASLKFQQILMKFDNLIAFRHHWHFSILSTLSCSAFICDSLFAYAFDVRIACALPGCTLGQTLPFATYSLDFKFICWVNIVELPASKLSQCAPCHFEVPYV